MQSATNLFAFLNPFHTTVWYSIIAGLFLVTVLLYALSKVTPKQANCNDKSLHGTFWFVYSSLVQQGQFVTFVINFIFGLLDGVPYVCQQMKKWTLDQCAMFIQALNFSFKLCYVH